MNLFFNAIIFGHILLSCFTYIYLCGVCAGCCLGVTLSETENNFSWGILTTNFWRIEFSDAFLHWRERIFYPNFRFSHWYHFLLQVMPCFAANCCALLWEVLVHWTLVFCFPLFIFSDYNIAIYYLCDEEVPAFLFLYCDSILITSFIVLIPIMLFSLIISPWFQFHFLIDHPDKWKIIEG